MSSRTCSGWLAPIGGRRAGVRAVACAALLASCLPAAACSADREAGPVPSLAQLGQAPAERSRYAQSTSGDEALRSASIEAPAPSAPPPPPPPQGQTAGPVELPTERKVIRNGSMQLEVPQIAPALEAIRAHVGSAGGYVSGESSADQGRGRAKVASITLRVPAARLDETVAKVRTLGRELSLSINAEDITEQYFNLEIRLRNQRELETRLRQLLERPSNRLTDLLEIEKEVGRVRGEIDEMEGRKRYWDNQVGFSTLMVNLQEPAPLVAGEQGGVWQTLKRALGEAGDNFVLTIAGIIAATGSLVSLAVALLVAFVVLRAIWRRWRRVRS